MSSPHQSVDAAPPRPKMAPLPLILSLVPVAASLVVVAIMGRSLWFYSDDWNIYTGYHSGNLLDPFNGHLSLLPVSLYQATFHTLGVGSYWPYRAWGMFGLALLGFQLVRIAGRRIGWTAAAVTATAVLWNEAGNTNLMFPFLMNFSIPIAALLACWWHLDRADERAGADQPGSDKSSSRNEVAASLWLAVALATSGLGIMVLGAVAVELLLGRAPLRRWLILSPGPLLWAAWFLTHRESSQVSTDVGAVAAYAGRMLLGGATSLAAGWQPGGVVVIFAIVALMAVAALRWRCFDARTIGALVAPLLFIALTALTRLDITPHIPPDELRYRWTIGAYLVFAILMMWRPSEPDRRTLRTVAPYATVAVAIVMAIGGARLIGGISDWVDQVAAAEPGLRSATFATEAVGPDRVDPTTVMPLSFVLIRTGAYLEAVADIGSPIAGLNPNTFVGNHDQNQWPNRLLVEDLPIQASPSDGTCSQRSPGGDTVEVLPGARLEVLSGSTGGPSELAVARFGAAGGGVRVALPPGRSTLSVPADDPSVASAGRLRPYRVVGFPGTSFCR